MALSIETGSVDADWGCSYHEVANSLGIANIRICFARVKSLSDFASQLSGLVLDTSWMMALDKGVRRQYDYTVRETATLLVEIFKKTTGDGKIGSEFGELMVSIGSARALEQIFSHTKLPIAELWKPQVKQNEGFDFHTVCRSKYINFGEAKYSAKENPHGPAISQAADFLKVDKHYRDRGHLEKLVPPKSIGYLDEEKFGVIAAFSINSDNPLLIFKHALENALEFVDKASVQVLYLVGVGEEC